MIAAQMAGKATRDAMFLSHFAVSSLPLFLMVSSALSVGVIVLTTRAMSRVGPARIVPAAFALSGILFFAEWGLSGPAPAATAVLVYFHVSVLGAILISGFWSMVNERFDPRAAKKTIARLAGAATAGGLVGGVMAERMAVMAPVAAMLPLLGGLNLVCAWATLRLAPVRPVVHDDNATTGVQAIRDEPYLRRLGWLVFVLAAAAALLDYVFKAEASAVFVRSEDLLRFFAIFYTAASLFAIFVQFLLSRFFLRRFGLVRTAATLPFAVSATGIGALFLPGLGSALLARGTESVLRGSLFRAGYELLYTAIPSRSRRASKAIIDVGAERLGDMAGGGLTRLVLFVVPQLATSFLMASAAALGITALFIARWLHQGYARLLERNLIGQAVDLDLDEVRDRVTQTVVLKTLGSIPVMGKGAAGEAPAGFAERIAWLKSEDVTRAVAALRASRPLSRAMIPFVIPLLGRRPLEAETTRALAEAGTRNGGVLADAFLDAATSDPVRRGLARILGSSESPLAGPALRAGLESPSFSVRYHSARALLRQTSRHAGPVISETDVFAAVRRELAVDRATWNSRGLVDLGTAPGESSFVDEGLGSRAMVSLEHVFTLLSLILPHQPLRIAFRGLHTDNPMLRGTAVEYLESVLPPDLQGALWPFLETRRERERQVTGKIEAETNLVKSHETIELNLAAIRARLERDSGGASES